MAIRGDQVWILAAIVMRAGAALLVHFLGSTHRERATVPMPIGIGTKAVCRPRAQIGKLNGMGLALRELLPGPTAVRAM